MVPYRETCFCSRWANRGGRGTIPAPVIALSLVGPQFNWPQFPDSGNYFPYTDWKREVDVIMEAEHWIHIVGEMYRCTMCKRYQVIEDAFALVLW